MKHTLSAIVLAASFWGCSAQASPPGPGKQVFDRWCSACHAPGPRMPGTSALAAKYGGQVPAALEERKDLTPDFVKFTVRHGVSIMAPFRKTEIADAELSALADYLSHKPTGHSGS
jgi:mono/diheme cytochrome c family protein